MSIEGIWRGEFEDVQRVGDDIRIDVIPGGAAESQG